MPALLALLALLAGGCAQGPAAPTAASAAPTLQAPAGQPFEPWLQAERERVARQREAAQQRYRDDELACWRRFAVNDCLGEAKRERRGQLDALRQQEPATQRPGARAAHRPAPAGDRAEGRACAGCAFS
jgi:hypothetical protein